MPAPVEDDGRAGETWTDRLKRGFLKPVPDDAGPRSSKELSPDELEQEAHWANDQERLLGVVAAPLAALIGILVGGTQISNAAGLHKSTGVYVSLLAVLVALSVAMLASALVRRRLFLGMAMALYGLGVFNLHYWGFGLPFIAGAAWLLVRSYRLQRDWREATSPEGRSRSSPRPSGRYTPPRRRRPEKP
jgi:hypothetical protein